MCLVRWFDLMMMMMMMRKVAEERGREGFKYRRDCVALESV